MEMEVKERNTASDMPPLPFSVSLTLTPNTPNPPTLLYIDKNCEVVRFHSASRAHSDGFQPPDVSAPQDDPMFAHTLPKNSRARTNLLVSECISKTFAGADAAFVRLENLFLFFLFFLRRRSTPAEGAVIQPSRCQDGRPALDIHVRRIVGPHFSRLLSTGCETEGIKKSLHRPSATGAVSQHVLAADAPVHLLTATAGTHH